MEHFKRYYPLLIGLVLFSFSCAQDNSDESATGAPDTVINRIHQPLAIPTPDSVRNIPFDTLDYSTMKFLQKRSKAAIIDSKFFPPAGDQLEQGSCAAFCTSYYVVSYYEKRHGDYDYGTTGNTPDYSTVYSPAFVFNGVKHERHDTNCEQGIEFAQAFGFVSRKGICKWLEYPYNGSVSSCSAKPGPGIFAKAAVLDKYTFRRINTDLETVKEYLALEIPVIVGLYPSATMDIDGYNHKNSQKPFIWAPDANDIDRYHAILCIGYNDNTRRFTLLNSWGFDWGRDGYCEVPYTVFAARAREFYVARINRGASLASSDKAAVKRFDKTISLELNRKVRVADTTQLSLFRKDIKKLRSFKTRTENQELLLKQLEAYMAKP